MMGRHTDNGVGCVIIAMSILILVAVAYAVFGWFFSAALV